MNELIIIHEKVENKIIEIALSDLIISNVSVSQSSTHPYPSSLPDPDLVVALNYFAGLPEILTVLMIHGYHYK